MPQTLATIRTEIQLVRRGVECKAIQEIHGTGLYFYVIHEQATLHSYVKYRKVYT